MNGSKKEANRTSQAYFMIRDSFKSAFVCAGASQFMGVNMIIAGATAIEIIFATFVLNFRHFVMSLSFMNELKEKISLKIERFYP